MRILICSLALLLTGWAHIRAGDGPGDPELHWTRDYQIPVHTHSAGYDGLPFNQVRGAIEAALATWSGSGITVSFRRDPDGQDGDTPAMDGVSVVRFEFDRLPREVDPDTVLAFTSHVGVLCTGTIAESDITFNAVTVEWSTSPRGRLADIETVMLHEAGHMLGLDHSDDRDAVMFPSIQQRVKHDLHADDRAGIRALYAANLGRLCERDADCVAGEACIYQVESDDDFDTRCGPRLGNAGVGQRCDSDRDFCDTGCAGGYCLGDDICSGVCRDDNDCPGDLTCLPQDTGGGNIVRFCLNLRLCEARVDQCPNGQACVVTRHPQEARALRICVDGGDSPVGRPCRASDECQGALCYAGVCTTLCDRAADCSAPFTCDEVNVPLGAGVNARIGLCRAEATPCGRQRDCADGLSCAYVELNDEVGSLCVPAEGGEAGDACRDGGDCRSAVCLDDQCSDVCRNDGDCPRSMECQRIRFLGASVNACVLIDEPDPPPPDPDAGEPPPPDPDGGQPPPPDRDAGQPPPPDPDDGVFVAPPDAAPAGRDSAVVVITPVGGGGSGQAPGCTAAPGAPFGWWWSCLLAIRRRRL